MRYAKRNFSGLRKLPRGGALWMTVLGTMLIMIFFIGSVLTAARSQTGLTADELGEVQARYAALGAINKAFIFLEDDPDWTGSWEYEQMPQNPDIFHSLEASREEEGLGREEIYLTAQGFTRVHGEGTPLAAVAGTAYRPSGGIQHAFFADRYLSLEYCIVDAYNGSQNLGYVPLPNPVPDPIPVDVNGDPLYSGVSGGSSVGSNFDINLQDTEVDGNVVAPLAGRVSNGGTTQGQGARVNSSGLSRFLAALNPRDAVDLPAIRVPFDSGTATRVIDESNFASLPLGSGGRILSPGAYQSVTVPDGQTLVFQSGDYYFEDSFSAVASPGSTINLRMASENKLTKIFVGGQFELDNAEFRPVVTPPPATTGTGTGGTSGSGPGGSAGTGTGSGSPGGSGTGGTGTGGTAPTISQPSFLRIYGVGIEDEDSQTKICRVRLSNTNFAGLIVGEAIEARFDNCEIWGAAMGRDLVAEQTKVHYDTSLTSVELADHSRWRLRGLTEIRTQQPN